MERLWRGLRWLGGTSWPLYAATVLGTNVLGAVLIMLFVRYLIPMPEVAELSLNHLGLGTIGLVYVILAVVVGVVVTAFLFRPVLEWQLRPDDHDPNMVRNLVLRLPVLQTVIVVGVWAIGIAIITIAAAQISGPLALAIGVSTSLACFVVAVLTYLQAERLVRPIAASALARRFEDSTLEPPIKHRLYMTWFTTSAVPMIGVLLLFDAQRRGFFTDTPGELLPAVFALTIAALITGLVGTAFVIMSVVDPIKELQDAINRVRRGEANTQVDIYDGSEIGVLQAGFNEMMRGLNERQRVRDIFGRYVGTEVAAKALEEKPELGGEDRRVAVLFIDVIGSTTCLLYTSDAADE